MKTGFSILLFCFFGFIGWVKFDEIKPIEPKFVNEWKPPIDGLMELNSSRNELSKAKQNCEISKMKAKQYIEELKERKKDTIYFVDSE